MTTLLTSFALVLLMLHGSRSTPPAGQSLPLAGSWQFALDSKGTSAAQGEAGRTFDDTIALPSTTDEALKGPEQPPTQEAWHLTRRHPYEGLAWYRRVVEVPAAWADRPAALYIERTKQLSVFLDQGPALDGGKNLSTSHLVPLGKLSPGEHTLTLCVDNRRSDWPDRVPASHMLEESTQTNWNGVLGRIELRTIDAYGIAGVRAGAVNGDPHHLSVRVYLDPSVTAAKFYATLRQNGKLIGEASGPGESLVIPVAKTAALWDEFHPNLCQLEVRAEGPGLHAQWLGPVGLRDFRSAGGHILINNRRTFLRGRHDACVFPLTGHPPMDEAGWDRYFRIVKSYGLNHVRFHSWCPPDAAFAAADRSGVYLQPELPFWGDPAQPGVEPFLTAEGLRILKDYGNHPSFVMLSLGNELWGSAEPRPRMVAALRSLDPTRMYDQGSNTEWWNPREAPGDDYRVAVFTGHGEEDKLRGSYAVDKNWGVGYIQTHVSGTARTYSAGLAGKHLPFISHEVGQYQTFPNFGEIPKYTGVVRADNFAVFQKRLSDAGMLDQAEDFRQASGHLAVQCYREEIEAALRTPEMDGFQLLDLQDYPGQGTALVGILDAFMDSKGLVTDSEWRSFCSPLVPLALFPKYTWRTDETFHAQMRVANYGPSSVHGPTHWTLLSGSRVVAQGTGSAASIAQGGVTDAGMISASLGSVSAPARLELAVSIGAKTITWPLWVYPTASAPQTLPPVVARSLDAAALARLASGGTVLYVPAAANLPHSLPGYYTPDFWCYPMFKGGDPPGTLGLLIQDKHPALAAFPTRYYSEWQWQELAHHSRAVILDSLAGYKPIVQPIDNSARNHRLGTVFELKVGPGKLLVCAIDLLDPALKSSPEAAQLLTSLVQYAGSPQFQPATEITPDALQALLGTPNQQITAATHD